MKVCFADRLFQVTKIDCIPDIYYLEVHAQIINTWFDSLAKQLNKKHSIYQGNFSYQCDIFLQEDKI